MKARHALVIAAIEAYLEANDNDPKPFVWTATAEKPRIAAGA